MLLTEAGLPLPRHDLAALRAPNRFSRRWVGLLVIADVLAFLCASYVAGGIVDRHWDALAFAERFSRSSFVFIALWLLVFERLGLYRRSFALSSRDEFYFTIVALILGIVPQFAVFTIFPQLSTSRLVLLLSVVLAAAIVGPVRATLHALRSRDDQDRHERVLLVGMDSLPELDGFGEASVIRARNIEVNDALAWLAIARARQCGTVVLPRPIPADRVAQVMPALSTLRIKLYFALPDLIADGFRFELHASGRRALLAPMPLAVCSPLARLSKRLFDVVLASVLLLLAAPVMAVTAAAIVIDSGFPVFFRQQRVGRGGAAFSIVKFRTMRTGAGNAWAVHGDDRITRLGRLLRRTSLDELPQLWNVLCGDMSLVGPRPEMISYAEEFEKIYPRYAQRHLVQPGVTGWAQIHMKRNLSPQDAPVVLEHDLFYVEHWSLFLDLSIIAKTAAEFLFHRAV